MDPIHTDFLQRCAKLYNFQVLSPPDVTGVLHIIHALMVAIEVFIINAYADRETYVIMVLISLHFNNARC